MKVLIHSNAPWVNSGYGQQTALLSERLKVDHDVAISAYFGLQGSPLNWNDIMVYPGGAQSFGQDVIKPHAEHHFEGQRGMILTLLDVWVLQAASLSEQPVASWVPLDHIKLQPVVRNYFRQSKAVPIAMSKFGKEQLAKNDIKAHYVPHGIDLDIFKPLDMSDCRDELDISEDLFVVGMVAANQGTPSRKCFPEALAAFKGLLGKHKDVMLYLHTDTSGRRGNGIDLVALAESLAIPDNRVMECDQYMYQTGLLSPQHMAKIYSSMDVLLNPSAGEGFGIPMAEAQACGTPVIATNASAMSEVAGIGWLVDGQEFYTGLGSFQMTPDVSDLVDALEHAYTLAGSLRNRACDFAQQYDVNEVYEKYWKPTIAEVSALLAARQVMELHPLESLV